MPWTTLTAGMRSLLKYWGSIQTAAATRTGVAGAWAAVKEGAAAVTAEIEGASIFDMNALYGLAAGNRNAADRFMAAGTDQVFDPAWVGTTPSARTPAARFLSPTIRARVNYTYLTETGELVNAWGTTVIEAPGTLTKEQLIATIEATLTAVLATTTPTRTTPRSTLVAVNTISLAWI